MTMVRVAYLLDQRCSNMLQTEREPQLSTATIATQDHFSFRKMWSTHHGSIYTGGSNGPEGPYDGEPYNFSFYEEGLGAKVKRPR
jgi:hypothetical protein